MDEHRIQFAPISPKDIEMIWFTRDEETGKYDISIDASNIGVKFTGKEVLLLHTNNTYKIIWND